MRRSLGNKRVVDVDDAEEDGDSSEQDVTVSLEKVKSRGHLLTELRMKYPDYRVYLDTEELPINWSTRKKLCHTLAYGATTFTSQFAATMLSPNASEITKEFHVSREVSTLIFSSMVLGNAIGPMIFAPLSEVSGRKIGVFIPCFISGVWLCVAANVSNAWAFLVFRFLAGIFAAAPIVSSGGALGDLWKPEHRAAALVLYAICIISGSSSAPTFGALLSETGSYGWRWTCWVSGLLQIIIPLFNMAVLSESFTPVLERQKARMLRIDTKVWQLHADLDAWKMTLDEFLRVHCMRPILMFMTPVLFLLVNFSAFVYGLMFICITSVSSQFQEKHHFSFVASYLPLFSIFVGFSLGGLLNIVNSRRYARIKKINGIVNPEERLPAMMFAGWTLPCGLFIYGWTMKATIHWFVPTIGLALLGCGIAIIFQGSLVYIVDCYTKYAASGIAANTFMRSVYGGVFPLFALQMFEKLGVAWAASLLGFVGLALWPCAWLFYYYGERLRKIEPYGDMLH